MSFFTPAVWQGEKGSRTPRIPECGRCGLHKLCLSPKMPVTGKGHHKILFVGEAPGETEDKKGVQLVGKAGHLLRDILRKRMQFKLDDAWKTNAVICRPPKNKIDEIYIQCCRPNLLRTIQDLKPRVIILLGGSAVRGLLPAEREADVGSITRWVGWRIPSQEHHAWICPTYHPSYLLRMNDKALNLVFSRHLEEAVALSSVKVERHPLEEFRERVERIPNERQAIKRVKDLRRKKGVLAFDYEANRLKPDHPRSKIVACSFCLDGEDTFSVLTTEKVLAEISVVLKNPKLKKVASNLKNEERWTLRLMGHPVASWYWDTMLAAHVLDNRSGITSLKFQVFVRFGIADYNRTVDLYFKNLDKEGFNRIDDCPVDELLSYNGLDSLFEFMLMEVQRKEMGMQ